MERDEHYRETVEREKLEDLLGREGRAKRFKITLCFRENLSENSARAVEAAQRLPRYYTEGEGEYLYHCVSGYPEDVEDLHALWQMIQGFENKKVLVNNYPLPYSQALWLLLFWVHRIR